MILSDLYSLLSYGELTNLSMAQDSNGNSTGTIATLSRPKIVAYTNEALLKIYSRFPLRTNDVLLQLYGHITFYRLVPKFATNYTPVGASDDEFIRYILDQPMEPFQDEVIKVTEVFDTHGRKLALNDSGNRRSVFTPEVKMLQVPDPWDDHFLSVKYQQRHSIIQGDLSDAIYCPDVLVPALTSYIAYKVFDHMGSQDGTSKAQSFLSLYESTCLEMIEQEVINLSTSQTSVRFGRGGWV